MLFGRNYKKALVPTKARKTWAQQLQQNHSFTGTPYYAKIEVFGGYTDQDNFNYDIQPEKSGLELSPRGLGTKYVTYNHLEVKGTPKVAGTITIELFGTTYGTNTCVGKRYDRVYTIKVEE